MSDPTVIIKKYENRRLYDTSNSRYVNLDDIAQMVREGAEIRVIDAATGEDLTRVVLTQIIVESAKVPDSPFPIDMLRQMIIASGRLSQEGLRSYMQAAFDLYQNTYRAFAQGVSPFVPAQQSTPGATVGSSPAASMGEESAVQVASQHAPVEDLRRRIEELELLVARGARTRPVAKRKRRARRKK